MHFKAYKNILSPKNGMNLYRGCTHGCIYCDSRSVCYQMQHGFEDVEVKLNAPELLREELKNKRKPCTVGTGAMSDPYLPEEKELQNMRRCLEIIRDNRHGVTFLTKSDLCLRDLDLLSEINKQSKCVVQMTLTTLDETLCKILEPNAPATAARVKALKIFKDNGIPTVVWLCPTLPYINDSAENLLGILELCKEANVYGIMNFGFGMTLREGNREYFYQKLEEHFPGLKEKYIERYANAYEVPSPNALELNRIFKRFCLENNIVFDRDQLFRYLQAPPVKQQQLSFLGELL